jgi:hypothetical protein
MKRVGHLWDGLVSFPNLLRAARTAARGKRFRPDVARFHFGLERELWRLHDELAAGTYRPGPYRTFRIRVPKERQISAAPYRDRVVHHALTQVLEPVFEPGFHPDSYACRRGKGTHAAVGRCQQLARRFRHVFKADVQKFFPSVDHEVLKGLLARRVKDPHVLRLAALIIDHSNPQEEVPAWFPGDDLFTPAGRRRGLPSGGAFNNDAVNVRSANRNDNGPADRNDNNGFRPASTLRRAAGPALPESAGPPGPAERAGVQSPRRRPESRPHRRPGRRKRRPGRSGRPKGSKAPPGPLDDPPWGPARREHCPALQGGSLRCAKSPLKGAQKFSYPRSRGLPLSA